MYRSLIKIKDLLESTFGGSFKNYIIDDPSLVPLSTLPCVCICPISTEINIIDNQRDSYTHSIDVIVIINAKQELMKYKQEMVGTQFLTEKMEGRNTSTGVLESNTILSVLRDNLTLDDNWYIQNIASIDYATRIREEKGEQFVTKESKCSFEIVEFSDRS